MATKKKKNPYEEFGLKGAGLSSGDNVDWKTDNPYEEYGQGYNQSERDPSLVWDWTKKEDVAKAVVETKKEDKPEERKRSFWEKFGDKFEANSPEDKAKRQAEGKPENYKDEPTKGYSSIGNRVGDIFEANSPQDKAKRIAAGEDESFQRQQGIEKEAKDRNKNINYTKEEVDARRDYFNRQGVDLDKALDLRSRYADIFKSTDEVKGKGIDWKGLAEQAKTEGLLEGNDKAQTDLEAGYQFEKQGNENSSRTFFRQSVMKALEKYDTKELQKIETDFGDFTASQGKEALPQQINRNFQRGLAEALVKFPGSARTLASGALDVVAPEGSRVDQFAQGQYNAGKENLKDVDEQLVDQGVGVNPNDNRFVGTVSAGAGSLTSSLLLGGIGNSGKTTEATKWLDKARQALNPGVPGAVFGTNAGAEQYIGAIDSGKSDFQAFATAIVAGAAEGYLEKLGVDKFLGADGGATKKFITRAISEGLQEASQSFSQNAVKSTYTSVDFSDALMQALEEGGYGAIIGGGASVSMSLAENMVAKGVPEDIAKATADKVAAKLEQVATEELPEADGDGIIQQLQGDETGQPSPDGTGQELPTDGDAIVQALQGDEAPVLPVDGTQQPIAGEPTDIPTDGDAIVQALQGEAQQFAVDQPVNFDGKEMVIVNVLKTNGDTKYELVDPQGSATKSIWTNQAGLDRENQQVPDDGDAIIKELQGETLEGLNPTGGVLVDYTPEKRATAKLGKNLTTINETEGGSPDDTITVYRGAPTNQKELAPGDFITTNYDLAKSYTGDGNVIEMEVRKGDVLDDRTEPGGEEYIYRPQADKELQVVEPPKKKGAVKKPTKETRREVSPIPDLSNVGGDGVVIKINSFGQEAYAQLLEEYKGRQIVQVGKDVAVWDSKDGSLFRVGLDDSKMSGPRAIVEEANTVENAKEYIDWLDGVRATKKKGAVKTLKKQDGKFSEKVEAEAMRLHNKPANKLSVTQLKSIVADTKATVTGGIELVQKLGSYRKGIAVDDSREALMYGGYNKGVYTDGYVLYNEPSVAKKIYEGIFADQERKFVNQVMRNDPKANRADAEKAAKEATKKNIESNESRFPKIEEVPTIQNNLVGLNGAKAEIKGYYENFVVLESTEGYAVLNTDLLAFADKQYPNATYRVQADPLAPVQIVNGDKIVGVIMPLKRGKENNVPAELLSTTPKKSSSTSGGNNALFNPNSRMNELSDNNSKSEKIHGSTRTVEDLIKLAQDLNKAGQANAMLRRGGSKSKKALGSFQSGGRLKGKERIMLQDAVINDPAQYVSTLAHELSHASEFQINGNTRETYKLFGELDASEKKQIGEELTAIVEWLESPETIASDPTYYNRPTEQLARYVQVRFLDKAMAIELAPLLTEKYDQAVERHPELKNLIDALEGELDKGFRNKVPNWYRDLRQTYQKNLGKRAGDEAYNAEIVRRAKIQKWRDDVSKLVKRKFKKVKDSPDALFKAAESIKMTDDDGNLVYGTRDVQKAQNKDEAKDLQKAGYSFVNTTADENGKEVFIFAKQRYTEEEGKLLFESLSPEGQQLVRDFTAQREKAKDFFNREVIKDVFKIRSELEGWVHRGLQEEAGIVEKVKGRMSIRGKKAKLKEQKAGAKKMRGGSENYLADFQKQMEKALLELGDEQINNEFIHKQLARISKPIAKGQMPEKSWTEVVVDRKRGVILPGEGGRDRVSIDKEDEMTGERQQYGFMKPEARYQIPTNLAKHYRNIRELPEEISTALRITKNLSKFWTINVLTDAGTVATNFIGGGIQYSAKILNDFYVELLTAQATLPQTRKNVASMVEILLPHGWSKAPDYLYGGVRNNQVGQFMTADRTEKALDKIGDVVLMPFATVESYWKKAIILSEGAKDLPKKELETEMVEFSRLEEKMIADMNNQADFYAFDYDNVPAWMEAWGRNPAGSLIKPFMKYPYKYSKMVTDLASGAFDKTLPVPERMAKLLTLTTLVGAAFALLGWRDEERETPEGTEKTPSPLRPGGRMFLGNSGENELFMRVSKYPFIDIASTGKALINGQFQAAGDILAEKVGSIGPYTSTGLTLLGYTNRYETYTPLEARLGKQAATFIPGFRVLTHIGKYQDPVSRRAETFVQGVFGSLPAWGDEETKLKFRGDRRTVDVPDEGESRSITEKSTTEKEIQLYRSDILLSALTGIYISRINPEDAVKQMRREQRNDAEQKIRALLADGKEAEAETIAKEVNMTIPEGTYNYYRRKRR